MVSIDDGNIQDSQLQLVFSNVYSSQQLLDTVLHLLHEPGELLQRLIMMTAP